MKQFLGEILVDMGIVSTIEINTALEKQMDGEDKRIGELLIEAEACTEEDVVRALATQNDIRYVNLSAYEIPPELIALIPRNIAEESLVIPVESDGATLTVAMLDPMDIGIIDHLSFTTSLHIEAAVSTKEQIDEAIEKHYGMTEDQMDAHLDDFDDIEYRDISDDSDASEDDAPVIKYVTQIIQNALDHGASDIHIEPMMDRMQIRYRIDGICIAMDPAQKRLQGPVIQRIKIMAGLQVEEKRRPQDGRIKAKLDGKDIDLRVSSLPAAYGESVVMRLLDSDSLRLSLEDMGFDSSDFQVYMELIKRPNGIILVTGPTGSGKTTTLYATLNTLNSTDRKIITAEDPVEYHLDGINQCQVRHRIGLTFPRILRAMLRQAPNIILVGEIRDEETATMAINASLTGHLVFSTLHTNDAPSAVTRLIDMGVPPFLVATSIQAIVAQRLIRTNCPRCIEEYEPERKKLRAIGLRPDQIEGQTFKRGKGCDNCNGTGYKGRKGLFELLIMSRQVRNMAFDGASTLEIRKAAVANGMYSLAMDGVRKVIQGVTTPDEILRVAKSDDI